MCTGTTVQGISGSGRVTTRAWDAGARTPSNWVDDEMNPTMTIGSEGGSGGEGGSEGGSEGDGGEGGGGEGAANAREETAGIPIPVTVAEMAALRSA